MAVMPRPSPSGRKPPQTFDELVQVLQSDFDELTRNQRKIAELVMRDPEGCAFMTISDMASVVGVNEATVVRFAAALGLGGYQQLTKLCQQMVQDRLQMVRRFDSLDRQIADGDEDVFQRVVFSESGNLSRTFADLNPDRWRETVTAIASADRVYVLGLRLMYSIAQMLSYQLQMIRDEVVLLDLGVGDLPDRIRNVDEGDTFIALGVHPYVKDTVRGLEHARGQGAKTIALTDRPSSPLARIADVSIYIDTTGGSLSRSLTGFSAIVQLLAGGVAAVGGDDTRERLSNEESFLDALRVHGEPGAEE
jgi:DNA-binding MurR/RpiR family transcriptional regulator